MTKTTDDLFTTQNDMLRRILAAGRANSGLKQTELADRANLKNSDISAVEKGRITGPTFVTVARWHAACNMSLDDTASQVGIITNGAQRTRTIARLEAICAALEQTTDHEWRDGLVDRMYQLVTAKLVREAETEDTTP